MKFLGKLRRHSRRFCRAETGLAAIELAFATPFLAILAVGLIDFGLAWTRQMQLANAARAGTQYAIVRKPNNNQEVLDIKTAALSAVPEDFGGTASVDLYFWCPDTQQEVNSDTVCPSGNNREVFVEIEILEDYEMLFEYFGIGGTLSLGDIRTVRLS